MKKTTLFLATILTLGACKETSQKNTPSPYQELADQYAEFTLTTDVTKLSAKEKEMIPLLIQVADLMEDIFWHNAYGDKTELFQEVKDSALINTFPLTMGLGTGSMITSLLFKVPDPNLQAPIFIHLI